MPNWCYTNYVFVGEEKEIKDLHDKIKSLDEMNEPLVESDFGKNWLGCLVSLFGGDWEKIYCRGTLYCLQMQDNTMTVDTETAWGPMNEVWNFICSQYKSIGYYYYAEESGNCYYATNDVSGQFFPDRYIVEQCSSGTELYVKEADLYEDISERVGTTVNSKESMELAIEAFNESLEDEDDEISVHEISIEI